MSSPNPFTGNPKSNATLLLGDNDTSLATTAFVKGQGYITVSGVPAESDPQVGANIQHYLSRWSGTALVAGQVFDNGTNVGIGTTNPTAKLTVLGNIIANAPTANNHVATKAYVDAAVGGGKYSRTCHDWSAKGWTSKNDCIQDGRWHLVFTNTSGGAKPNAELTGAIISGADIKVGMPDDYDGTGDTCNSAFILDGNAICLGGARYSGTLTDSISETDNTLEKNIGVALYKSNGLLTCVSLFSTYGGYAEISAGGCGPAIYKKMDWYVKY